MLQQLLKKLPLPTLLTLMDQAGVSGSNFLLGILLTRWMGLEGYGYFALAWLGVMFASSLHQAAIIMPMMSLGPKKEGATQRAYYQASFWLQLGFVSLVGLFGLVLSLLPDSLKNSWEIASLFPYWPWLMMAFVAQEYVRRYAFITFRPQYALLLDILAYGGMLAGVLWAYISGIQLSEVLLFTTLSFALSTAIGLWVFRELWLGMNDIGKAIREALHAHWQFSSWLLGKAVLQFFSGNYFLIAAGTLLGPTALGALRMAQNLVGLTHVLFLAMENAVPVKASLAYGRDGWTGLWRYLRTISVKAGSGILAILLSLALGSKFLISWVYGAEYQPYAYLLISFCALYVLLLPGYPLRFALRAIESTQALFWAYLLNTGFSLLAAHYFVHSWQEMGVLYGMAIGHLIMTACLTYWLLNKRNNLLEIS